MRVNPAWPVDLRVFVLLTGGSLPPYHRAIMFEAESLPDEIRPWQLIQSEESIRGQISTRRMSRLRECVNSDCDVAVDLSFVTDEAGTARIGGVVQAELEMICQRCLAPVLVPLRCKVGLALTRPGSQERSADSRYEALECGDEPISLLKLVEDELLLALPPFPKHGEDECSIPAQYIATADVESPKRDNPFAVLRDGKKWTLKT